MPWIEHQLTADGIAADGRIVMSRAIYDIAINSQVLSLDAVGGNNGSGYVVGETFDIVGGTAISVNGVALVARGRVTAITGDDVTAIEIVSAGAYSALPGVTNVVTTNSSLAGDNLLTVDLTTQIPQWTSDRNTYVDDVTDFEWIVSSIKASNPATVGMLTSQSGANDAVRLVTASGFDAGSTWLTQTGAPPTNEFFINCPNQDPQLFVSVTERRINVMVSDGTFKQYGGIGTFIPITDVEGNYPFPGISHGQTRSIQAFNEVLSATNRGICNPADLAPSQIGQYQYRNNLSTEWFGISSNNNGGADTARAQIWPDQGTDSRYQFNHAPVPAGSGAAAADMNPFNSDVGSGQFEEGRFYQEADDGGSERGSQGPARLGPGNQLHQPSVLEILSNQPNDTQIIGIIDGFERIHGRGLNAFDEVRTSTGVRYLVFNDTNASEIFRWVAMEKR